MQNHMAPLLCSMENLVFSGSPLPDGTLYRSLVVALLYLTHTWPDITFAVNQVYQFMHSPTDVHISAVKRILRFLKGTLTHGIYLSAKSLISLQVYSDADWAGAQDDRR